VSGGPPAAVIVAFDAQPKPPTRRQKRRFPLLTNARLLEKESIREAFNREYPASQQCNTLHSSDNEREAWEYIETAMPERADAIRGDLNSALSRFHSGFAVVQDFTRHGVRAKIERVEYQGRPAICKTFKPGRERFCEREAFALGQLSYSVPEIPVLLNRTADSVVYPFYEDVLDYQRSSGMLIPLPVARAAMAALCHVYEAGYALVDATIDNVLVDKREGLKLIDFEFLHAYAERPASFAESYDIVGCPTDFSGDLPAGGGKSYERHWKPYIGLSFASLQRDPPWMQHMKRTLYVALRPHRYLPRRARHVFRQATKWLLGERSKPEQVEVGSAAAAAAIREPHNRAA
jgi:hypothetical protein